MMGCGSQGWLAHPALHCLAVCVGSSPEPDSRDPLKDSFSHDMLSADHRL